MTQQNKDDADQLVKYIAVPRNAVFPVPPVCTVYWTKADWYSWWKNSGGHTTKENKA